MERKANPKILTIKYAVLMAAYWGSVCCSMGFSSTFLLARGFSSTMIGLAVAIGNILAVIAGPKVSAIADRSKKIKIHHLVLVSAILMMLSFASLLFVTSSFIAIFAIFFVTIGWVQLLQPLTNSVSIYYINRGIKMNFGAPRAMGSLCYGVISTLLGMLVVRFDVSVIPIGGVAISLVLIIAILLFPINVGEEEKEDKLPAHEKTGFIDFMKKYPTFPLIMIGIVLIFIFQTISNNYLMQLSEVIGGDASTVGFALTCQAFIELPPMILYAIFARKHGSIRLLIFSALFFIVKAFGFVLVSSPVALYLVMILQMLSYAVYIPASVDYVNATVSEEDQFQGQAMITSASTLGAMAGSFLGGVLIDSVGILATQRVDLAICTVGAVIMILPLVRQLRNR